MSAPSDDDRRDQPTANPYKSPDDVAPTQRSTFKDPSDKWIAIGLLLLGAATLCYAAVLLLTRGIISSRISGGGVALIVLGWLKWGLSPRRVVQHGSSQIAQHGAQHKVDPYQASQALAPAQRGAFKNPFDKWTVIGLLLAGVALIGFAAFMFVARGQLSGWFGGGGVGLLVLGWLKCGLSPRRAPPREPLRHSE